MSGLVVTLLIAGGMFFYVSFWAWDERRPWEAAGAYVMAAACCLLAGVAALST